MREKLAAMKITPPLYMQLARDLRENIENGKFEPGAALPSERELSEAMGLSRVTVRRGIRELIEEGLLFRRHGAGTYVSKRIETPGSALSSFTADARSRGQDPGVIWMMRAYASATEEEASMLGLPPNAKVARLARVRLANGEPLAIEHAVVPAELLPDMESLEDSLYEALEKSGARPVAGTQKVRASLATPTEAGMLSVAQNSEVLRIERLAHDEKGRPVEFTRSTYRGDRFEFVSEIGRSQPVQQS